MNDLISRQALCEYALNQKDKSVTPNDIMRFPSAQSEVNRLNDLISRRAAIDALEAKKDKSAKGDIGCFYNTIIQNNIDVLKGLPSAQPEVIRCKDCKFYTKMQLELGTGICSLASRHLGDDGFCSEAERRNDG